MNFSVEYFGGQWSTFENGDWYTKGKMIGNIAGDIAASAAGGTAAVKFFTRIKKFAGIARLVKQFANANGKLINGKVRIPDNWEKRLADNKDGYLYYNPKKPEQYIRLAYNSKNEYGIGPYMRIHEPHGYYDINGKLIEGREAFETHIEITSVD